jgi:hypothetical protein
MSLIVARMVDGLPCLFGDTKLSFAYCDSQPFLAGCLKQYIINPTLAIGFAGDKNDFERVLPNILSCTTLDEVVGVTASSQLGGLDFELVVADARRPLFTFIKNGVDSEAAAGYVGCNAAFDQFQRNLNHGVNASDAHAEPDKADLLVLQVPASVGHSDTHMRIFQALKLVVEDLRFQSVGGAIVPLCVDIGSFKYMGYVDRHSAILDLSETGIDGRAIEFGNAISGGYCIEFWDNSVAGGSGQDVGLYFLQGGIGVAFPQRPSGLREALLVKAENPAEWVLKTRQLYGAEVYSAYLNHHHCSVAGRRFIEAEDFVNALSYYDLKKDTAAQPGSKFLNDQFAAEYAVALFNSGHQADAQRLLSEIADQHADAMVCAALLREILRMQ